MSKGLFLRESSGLVREIGPVTALLMNTAYITFQSGYLLVVSSLLNFPMGNPVAAVLMGMVLFIPMAYLVNYIGSMYYRTASDYVFMSRNLNPRIGFSSLLMFTIDQMFFNAVSMVFALTTALGPSLYAIAVADNEHGLVGIASALASSPHVIFLVSALMLVILIVVNMVSIKAGKYLSSALSIIAVLTYIITVIILILEGRSLEHVVNQYVPGFYQTVIKAGLSLSGGNVVYSTIALVPYMAYIFPYVNFIVTIGSEVRREGSSMSIAVLGTYAITSLLVGLGIWLTVASLTEQFINGAFAIYYGMVSGVSWPSSLPPPYPPAIAIMLVNSPILQWLIAVGSLTWYINSPSTIVLQIARYLFAMSFDRVLPSVVSYVSPRLHTPIVAHAIDLAGSLLILYLYVYSVVPSLSATMDISTLVTIMMYFMVLSISAIAHGIRFRKVGIAVVGAYLTSLFAWICYMEIMNPMAYLFTELTNTYIIMFFAAVFIAGLVIFEAARRIRISREGIDILYVFKEIPPE